MNFFVFVLDKTHHPSVAWSNGIILFDWGISVDYIRLQYNYPPPVRLLRHMLNESRNRDGGFLMDVPPRGFAPRQKMWGVARLPLER